MPDTSVVVGTYEALQLYAVANKDDPADAAAAAAGDDEGAGKGYGTQSPILFAQAVVAASALRVTAWRGRLGTASHPCSHRQSSW